MTDWTNPLGMVWVVEDSPLNPYRARPPASRSVAFALAPRAAAAAMLVAPLGPAVAAPVAAAGQDPVIRLPPNPGGQTTGEDNAPAGAPAAEDRPDPSTPGAVPAPVVEEPVAPPETTDPGPEPEAEPPSTPAPAAAAPEAAAPAAAPAVTPAAAAPEPSATPEPATEGEPSRARSCLERAALPGSPFADGPSAMLGRPAAATFGCPWVIAAPGLGRAPAGIPPGSSTNVPTATSATRATLRALLRRPP
jgi:hypothetical protein